MLRHFAFVVVLAAVVSFVAGCTSTTYRGSKVQLHSNQAVSHEKIQIKDGPGGSSEKIMIKENPSGTSVKVQVKEKKH